MPVKKGIAIGIAALAVLFVLGLYGLGWQKFFAPKRADIRREVFEETKSYVHGKIQDLARYHDEWQRAETDADREAIRQVVLSQFAEFDESKIQATKLRAWLVQMRGY